MGRIVKIIKDWMLVISMAFGVALYLVYHAIPSIHSAGPVLLDICKVAQPVMLFMMLFLAFSKVEPKEMKPRKWMGGLLLVQTISFLILAAVVWLLDDNGIKIPVEAAMLCLITPTATACSVVTGKLGGDMAGVISYTVIINLVVAILVPLVVPVIHPVEGVTFFTAFVKILTKVFPLLILPALTAWAVRVLSPKASKWLMAHTNLSFDIWTVSLSLAILMSTRAIVKSGAGIGLIGSIALASLLACAFQFWIGRAIGAKVEKKMGASGEYETAEISAGQALGQKNTVFSIWMGYTFLDPIVSVTGGFYSIWHNCYNSYQLYRKNHQKK